MNTAPIPVLDPTPLPGPPWLFHVLLVFTFILHALFMNLALGGTLLATFAQMGSSSPARRALAERLTAVNGYGISFAVTTAIAPLLFVQLLFQQYFYPATILIGNVWLLLIALLLVGYYSVYVYKFRKRHAAPSTRGGGGVAGGSAAVARGSGGVPGASAAVAGGGVWLVIASVCFFAIAMVHVAVNLIHSQPNKWTAIASAPWSILGDPSYFPRLLHFLMAALGLTSLVMTWWSARQAATGHDVEVNSAIARYTWKWVLWTTVVQLVDGIALLGVLPSDVLVGIMNKGAATLLPLAAAVVLAMGVVIMLARTPDPVAKRGAVNGTLAAMLAAIAVMAIVRHEVRGLYLASSTAGTSVQSASQWLNFVLFVLLLIAGLATAAWMVRRVLADRALAQDAGPA